jgi:hypothetical protein
MRPFQAHTKGIRMTRNHRLITRLALFLPALAASVSIGVEVNLTVTETEKVARAPAVITTGIPFARGAVKDAATLAAVVGGKSVPAQFIKTVAWDDGSVRWALLDMQAGLPAGGKLDVVVSDRQPAAAPPTPVKIDDGADALKVSTGPLQFAVSKKKAGLFSSITVDGRELVTAAGRGLVVIKDAAGAELQAAAPASVTVEQAGPMRALICARGTFPGVHNGLLGYTVRITAYAGQKHLKVQVWIENHGAMGYFRTKSDGAASPNAEWFAFNGMNVELGLGLGAPVLAQCEDVRTNGNLRVLQLCKQNRTQDKNRRGPYYTWDDFEYTVASQGTELKKGARTDGVLHLQGPAGTLTAAIRGFWQNYEKAMELDGAVLKLSLWPTEGSWPRPFPRLRDGGLFCKTRMGLPQDGLYLLPGSVQKGHAFTLDFSGRAPAESAAEISAPLMALATPAYYAATEAVPGLFAPPQIRTADRDCNAKLEGWTCMTRGAADPANAASIWQARQIPWWAGVGYVEDSAAWFGWMDFGDLSVPGAGPVSLHYDWTWIMLLNALRMGDMNFLRLGADMADHRMDVDQFWSDRDLPECRGVERPAGGSPSFHCNRMMNVPGPFGETRGVALYYMLTGEPRALASSLRCGEGLLAAWAWVATNKPYGGPQSDMFVNASSISSYAALYSLTADRKWLDAAMGLLTAYVVPTWKQLGPFLHDGANQIQSQDYIQTDMKYCYSIATFCELHHLSNDAELFKMLQEGAEKTFPDSFFDAPLFLADLYAYVGLKTGNRELQARATDAFAQSFPESKCPPVFLADNSTWSRTAAMTLRTGHLLQYAAWKLQAADGVQTRTVKP